MPAACPPDADAPRTMEAARQDVSARQAAQVQQQQMTIAQHQGLTQKLYEAQRDAAIRQAMQINPLLNPPNFRADAQVVRDIVNGTGNSP